MFAHPFAVAAAAALALLLVSAVALKPVTTAGGEHYISEHNYVRYLQGVREDLQWSEKLAFDASLFARYRRDKFRCTPGIVDKKVYNVGSNQLLLRSSLMVKPYDVVEQWVTSRFYYDHGSNSCFANYPCGDYTQVMWRNSTYLGCAQASCGPDYGGVNLIVCFYYPPGNIPGESPY